MVGTAKANVSNLTSSRMADPCWPGSAATRDESCFPPQEEEQLYQVLRKAIDDGLRGLASFLASRPGPTLSAKCQLEVHQLIVKVGVRALDAALLSRRQ